MADTCLSCRRPVPLTPDEIVVLSQAAGAPHGAPLDGHAPEAVRVLVRMGYVVKVARDRRVSRPVVVITDRGRQWLADLG